MLCYDASMFFKKTFKKIPKIFIILAIFVLPNFTLAQIKISEIMYNPEGTDTGREWIEIQNISDSAINLTEYILFENNVNHRISSYLESGDGTLNAGDYAIIADNPAKFLIDFPNFDSSRLFDSAFYLNNTGESLSFIDSDNNIIDRFEYSVDLGANNTGNSLQRNSADFWIPALPTPGQVNSQQALSETSENDSGTTESTNSSSNSTSNSDSAHSGQNELSNYKEKAEIEIGAGRERNALINFNLEFEAIYKINGESKTRPKFYWNFGDGGTLTGQKVTYRYENAGEYNIILNAKFGDKQATTRTKVLIYSPTVEISSIISGKAVDIMLKNNDNKEINLGDFIIKVGNQTFKIPKDTIISSKSSVIFSNRNTNIILEGDFKPPQLLDPAQKIISTEELSQEKQVKILQFLIK